MLLILVHWKPQVNHLTHLSRSVSLHGQKTHFLHIFESFCPCTDPLWLKWVKWFTRVFLCISMINLDRGCLLLNIGSKVLIIWRSVLNPEGVATIHLRKICLEKTLWRTKLIHSLIATMDSPERILIFSARGPNTEEDQ